VIAIVILAALCAAGGSLVAQTTLEQLGLTETAARNFVLAEVRGPASNRAHETAVAGTRAFLKLPPAARGAAATGLFAWVKSHVNSPAFKTSYATYRNGLIPEGRQYALSVEEEVKRDLDEQLAGYAQLEEAAAAMAPAQRAAILESVKKGRATLTDPAFIKQQQAMVAEQRAQKGGAEARLAAEAEERVPADPQRLFARRLREFLDATADVNFSARTMSLTGGPDGIEFLDKADRQRHWIWQQAVIVGPEATAAARAAAQAWLKEIER
jgi:hypothetical protein